MKIRRRMWRATCERLWEQDTDEESRRATSSHLALTHCFGGCEEMGWVIAPSGLCQEIRVTRRPSSPLHSLRSADIRAGMSHMLWTLWMNLYWYSLDTETNWQQHLKADEPCKIVRKKTPETSNSNNATTTRQSYYSNDTQGLCFTCSKCVFWGTKGLEQWKRPNKRNKLVGTSRKSFWFPLFGFVLIPANCSCSIRTLTCTSYSEVTTVLLEWPTGTWQLLLHRSWLTYRLVSTVNESTFL